MLRRVRVVIRHAMSALFPRSRDWPGIVDTGVDEFLVRFMRDAPISLRVGVRLGAFVFMFFPLITIGIPLPSFLLPAKTLDRYAAKISSHPIYLVRQAVFLVKMVAGLCWAAHPTMRKNFALPAYPPDPGTWRTK